MPPSGRQDLLHDREGAFFHSMIRQMTRKPSEFWGSAQCLCEVVDDILYIFDTDGEPDQIGANTTCDQFFVRELLNGGKPLCKSACRAHGQGRDDRSS